jgi:hypothetical protein
VQPAEEPLCSPSTPKRPGERGSGDLGRYESPAYTHYFEQGYSVEQNLTPKLSSERRRRNRSSESAKAFKIEPESVQLL